jgi:hypothetical protein
MLWLGQQRAGSLIAVLKVTFSLSARWARPRSHCPGIAALVLLASQMEPKSRFGSWRSDAQLAEGGTLLAVLTVMRVIALMIVISMTFAIVLTHSPPILAKPTLLGLAWHTWSI